MCDFRKINFRKINFRKMCEKCLEKMCDFRKMCEKCLEKMCDFFHLEFSLHLEIAITSLISGKRRVC